MRECTECGSPYHEAAGWSPGVCGQCLADQIEASLMLQLLVPRKPAKRANEYRETEATVTAPGGRPRSSQKKQRTAALPSRCPEWRANLKCGGH
jgi:hypothetical protein